MLDHDPAAGVRLDIWLDVACLFRTRSEAQKAGRNPAAIEFSCMTRSVTVDDLKMLSDIGVSRVVVNPPGTKPEAITQGLEKFQEELISRI